MTKESSESEEAFERYKLVVDLLSEIDDKKGLKLVRELIKYCIDYVQLVNDFETLGNLRKFRASNNTRAEAEEYVQIDHLRKLKHEALLSQLQIVNRYLFRSEGKEDIPAGGIYSFDPVTIRDRIIVANWAKALVDALFRRGITI